MEDTQKTTIELSVELKEKAKQLRKERGIMLKTLVNNALAAEIARLERVYAEQNIPDKQPA